MSNKHKGLMGEGARGARLPSNSVPPKPPPPPPQPKKNNSSS